MKYEKCNGSSENVFITIWNAFSMGTITTCPSNHIYFDKMK